MNNQFDRLSPPRLKGRTSWEIEIPKFLDDRFLVDSPEKVLDELKAVQQKAWLDLKTVKARAWHSFIRKDGTAPGTVVMLEISLSRESNKQKELAYYLKDAFRHNGTGERPLGGGLDPDSKDEMFCLNAAILAPEMKVHGHFLRHVRNGIDEVEIYKPEYNLDRFVEIDLLAFQFPDSPAEFFETTLPDLKKKNHQIKVKKKGDLIELAVWNAKSAPKPISIWLFDLSKNGSTVIRVEYSRTHETEFVKFGNFWLPKKVTEKSSSKYSETKFFDWVVNQAFDEDEFAIGSLPALDGTQVRDKRTGKKARFQTFKK